MPWSHASLCKAPRERTRSAWRSPQAACPSAPSARSSPATMKLLHALLKLSGLMFGRLNHGSADDTAKPDHLAAIDVSAWPLAMNIISMRPVDEIEAPRALRRDKARGSFRSQSRLSGFLIDQMVRSIPLPTLPNFNSPGFAFGERDRGQQNVLMPSSPCWTHQRIDVLSPVWPTGSKSRSRSTAPPA